MRKAGRAASSRCIACTGARTRHAWSAVRRSGASNSRSGAPTSVRSVRS